MYHEAYRQAMLSPEFRLLVAACRWPHSISCRERLDRCLEEAIHWERFLLMVDRHRVVGLVYHALALAAPVHIPADVLAVMKQRSEKQLWQCMGAAGEASRLTSLLDREGIPCLTLKGPSLAILAYGSLALRHCKDNDLLVSPQDVSRAHAILLDAGYRREKPANLVDDKHTRIYMRHRNQFEYFHERTKMQAELHWRMYENNALAQFDPRSWSDRQTVSLGGSRSVRTLSDDALLPYLCLHGAMHGWFRLKWLVDIQAMLPRSQDAAARVLDAAAALGACRAAEQAIRLCHKLWEIPLPSSMPPDHWTSRRLVAVAYDAIAKNSDPASSSERAAGARVHASHFLIGGTLRYVWHEMINELMLPDDWAKTPKSLRFLHPFLRLPRWLIGRFRRTPSPLHPAVHE